MSASEERLLKKLRAIIEAWPETHEKISHGSPTWWGGKRTFATFHDGHYDNGKPSVWIKAELDAQEALIDADPARFFRPKYVGHKGWVGVRLHRPIDWAAIEALLMDGYRSVAPKRALKALADES